MKYKIATSLLADSLLVGCGGKSNNSTQENLSGGKVSDGYIAGANILVDINNKTKGVYDKGDYTTTTNADGSFLVKKNITVPKNTFIVPER